MNYSRIIFLWLIVVIMASSASILTRFCKIPAVDIGFWRVFGAAVILFPIALIKLKGDSIIKLFSKGSIICGVLLGLHFSTWCWAIQHTTIANATLFIGLQPLIVPFLAHWIVRERINKWEISGLIFALMGTIWLSMKQIKLSPSQFNGVVVALLSAFLCASYIVFTRRYRKNKDAFVFSTAVFTVAAILQGIFAIILYGKISTGDTRTVLALCGLIIFPTIGGHALMMFLLRYAKSQLMALTVPAQFVLATLAAYPIFAEKPQGWFYPGAIMVMIGIIMAVWKADTEEVK